MEEYRKKVMEVLAEAKEKLTEGYYLDLLDTLSEEITDMFNEEGD